MKGKKFAYSKEVITGIEGWFSAEESYAKLIRLAKSGSPNLVIELGDCTRALADDAHDIGIGHILTDEVYQNALRKEKHKIYGLALCELDAWDKLHPKPQAKPQPNKYFDDEVSK